MTERKFRQLSLKGPQTLEGLGRKGQQIDFAISRLRIVLDEIGTTDLPSYLRKGRRDSARHPLFAKLNAHNLDSLPPLERSKRLVKTAEVINDVSECIIPGLEAQKSQLEQRVAEAELIVDEAEEVKKMKQILTGLEDLQTGGARIGNVGMAAIKQDLDYLRRKSIIYFDSQTQPPTAQVNQESDQISSAETGSGKKQTQTLDIIVSPPPIKIPTQDEYFRPEVSDLKIKALSRIINESSVTTEVVIADLALERGRPVTVKRASLILKEAVNFIWLRVKEGRASTEEIDLWATIQILSGKGDMGKDLKEFHNLLEKWFEKPKKLQQAYGTELQSTTSRDRQTSSHPVPAINVGPFPKDNSLKLITIENAALAQNLLKIVPDLQPNGKPIDEETASNYPDQALALAIFTADLAEGRVKPISNAEIMQTADFQKTQIAQNVIRQRLAQLITRNLDKPLENYRYRWARDARDIIDWLGVSGVGNFAQAVDNLPDFERAMVITISSLTLLEDLGYLDLDECNEESFISYIRNASFRKQQSERDDSFELLINTLVERDYTGTIDLHQVVEGLLELDYVGSVFDSLLESAKILSFQDKLIQIFSSHTQTSPIAKKLDRDLLFEDFNKETLPHRRIMP